ncbi:autotransporter adhesin [Volucribacter psittacicida]|uniref:Autotransporter adhesin n=1 Tax=Volucribacter psittacicida TaxID=203482 RepID=A0A4R1FST2_9PAST|nr:YadA-like family protein [Volucribacter psittacicida]TCJ97893.1 autotransporter adhesin [Volucribacter psittacicida]
MQVFKQSLVINHFPKIFPLSLASTILMTWATHVQAQTIDYIDINSQDTTTTDAQGKDSIATGQGAKTSKEAEKSIAIGAGATVETNQWYATNATSRKLKQEYSSIGAIAIGSSAKSVSEGSISLGQNAKALQQKSIAIGINSNSSGWSTIAIGDGAAVISDFDMSPEGAAAGKNEEANKSKGAIAIGQNAKAQYATAISMGQNAKAEGQATVAIGRKANALVALSTAVGADSLAEQAGASAFGALAKAKGYGSTAIGDNATVTNEATYGTALGMSSRVTQTSGIALGILSEATGRDAIATGFTSLASGYKSIATGSGTVASGNMAIAIGSVTTQTTGWNENSRGVFTESTHEVENASGDYSIMLGVDGIAAGEKSIVLGYKNNVKGTNSSAVGSLNTVIAENANVVGSNITADVDNSIYLGTNSRATAGTKALTSNGLAGQTTTAGLGTVSNTTLTFSNGSTATFGNFAGASAVGVVTVGASGAERRIQNVAAGEISANSTDAINGSQLYAITYSLTEQIKNLSGSIDIKPGKNIEVTKQETNNGSGNGDTTKKTEYTISTADNVEFNKVKVGDITIDSSSKKITGLNEGEISENSKEAINGSQLYEVKQTVSKGLNFGADQGSVVNRQLGDTMTITGDSNITTKTTPKGVQVTLNKDINLDSVTTGNTKMNNNGITIRGGANGTVSLTQNGLDNGGNRITNVAAGVNPTDAVNVSQLGNVENRLNDRINRVDNKLRAGIAGAAALGMLAQPTMPGKSMVAVSGTNYRGESAMALGVSRVSDNSKWVLKLGASANTRSDYLVGASAGYQW